MKNLPKKIRSKKLSTRVDLTAMVSISFLLIIFFMVVGELSKPKILEQIYPSCRDFMRECNKSDDRRLITILLDKDNRIITYSGLLFAPMEIPTEVKYGKNGIRKTILEYNKKVLQFTGDGRGATVIIKPSKNSNYGNLVDILDEMRICNITSYIIADYYSPEESKLLASN